VNISSPHDLLLISVPDWWGGKVLGPSSAKPRVSFLPQEKPGSYVWQWPCECCEFSALRMSNSALLSRSPGSLCLTAR